MFFKRAKTTLCIDKIQVTLFVPVNVRVIFNLPVQEKKCEKIILRIKIFKKKLSVLL